MDLADNAARGTGSPICCNICIVCSIPADLPRWSPCQPERGAHHRDSSSLAPIRWARQETRGRSWPTTSLPRRAMRPPFSPQRRAPESKQDRHLHVWGRATAGRLSARLPASVLRRATGPAGRHKTAAVPSKPLKSAPFSTAKSLPCARAAARPLASRPGGCAVRGPWTGRQQRPPEPSPAGGQARRQSGARGSVQGVGNCGPSQVPRPGPARGEVGDRRGGANLRVGCS